MTTPLASLPRESFFRGPQWASAEAQKEWAPRILAAQQLWRVLELESVGVVRSSALLVVGASELMYVSNWASRTGRQVTLLEVGNTAYRVAVHDLSPHLSSAWSEAWANQNNSAIGALLQFPVCCRDAFDDRWVRQGLRDLTIAQAGVEQDLSGTAGCNTFLRMLGVRLVPHLPCSFRCGPSEDLSQKFQELALTIQAGESLGEALSLLSLPMEYSTLHGTARLETLHFWIEFESDYQPLTIKLSRPSLATSTPVLRYPHTWTDNGFTSLKAMTDCHSVILNVAVQRRKSILDLGCGDGALLEKFRVRGVERLVGYECDPERVQRGRMRYPLVTIEEASIQYLTGMSNDFDLTLFMPGRLLEMSEEDAARVTEWLLQAPRLLLYSYDGSLAEMCQKVKLPVPKYIVRGHGVPAEAGFIRPRGE